MPECTPLNLLQVSPFYPLALPKHGREVMIGISKVFCLQAADLLQIECHIHAVCKVLASKLFGPCLQTHKSGIHEFPEKVLFYPCLATFSLLNGAFASGLLVYSLYETFL
jgi:hypothetical protein